MTETQKCKASEAAGCLGVLLQKVCEEFGKHGKTHGRPDKER